jgi:nicotinate-nucleotide adenylyltransferase
MALPAVTRVGVFGGSFDPPHNAHLALASTAIAALKLDVLHIIPTGQAAYKTRTLSPAAHRLAMAHLAFATLPAAQVDSRELHRAGYSYTIDTLHELAAQYPKAQLHLVMGGDQFAHFGAWHRFSEIPQIATLCIAQRDHLTLTSAKIGVNMPNSLSFEAHPVRLDMPSMAVSATDIRQKIALHQDVSHLLAPAVAQYIAEHGLYTL